MQELIEKHSIQFVLTACLGWLYNIVGNLKKKNLATQKGVQALLRSSIVAIYNRYIEKGYMPIYEKENLEHLYDEYKNLDGNGVIEKLYNELLDLPTSKKEMK